MRENLSFIQRMHRLITGRGPEPEEDLDSVRDIGDDAELVVKLPGSHQAWIREQARLRRIEGAPLVFRENLDKRRDEADWKLPGISGED